MYKMYTAYTQYAVDILYCIIQHYPVLYYTMLYMALYSISLYHIIFHVFKSAQVSYLTGAAMPVRRVPGESHISLLTFMPEEGAQFPLISHIVSHLLPRLHPVRLIQSIQCVPCMQNILCIQCTQCSMYTIYRKNSVCHA